uniref:CCR4-NOT transcription complex subunit 2 n=1 Tax=Aegilops tauschii TaxID=37682 RepID=N1R5S5_AEGTA
MSGSLNSNIGGDSTGRPFTSTFSGQSGSFPNFHHSGIPSPGVQQPGGNISGSRFPSNNLPVSMSQISHGHSGISNRGGMNVGGNAVFSSSMNAIGGSAQGLSSSMANVASPQFMNILGSSYPTPGGTLSQNQVQAGNNSFSSSGMLHDGNSGDNSPFDINDFPQLTGRPNSAGGGQGQYGNATTLTKSAIFSALIMSGSLRKQGVSVNAIVQQNQEFSIQNEDFPALPGYKGNSSDYGMDLHHKDHLHENANIMQAQHFPMGRSSGFNLGGSYPPRQQQQQSTTSVQNGLDNIGLRPINSPSPSSNSGSYEQLIQQYHQPQTQNSLRSQTSSGQQPSKDQSQKSAQGKETVPDPYSLLGLLNLIKSKEPGPTALALGLDLTTLGLNLNSPDCLWKTFGSPWSNEPAKGEPDYQIPACYSAEQPPPLQPFNFPKFHPLTLFYIFYSMPKDVAQLYAANEL